MSEQPNNQVNITELRAHLDRITVPSHPESGSTEVHKALGITINQLAKNNHMVETSGARVHDYRRTTTPLERAGFEGQPFIDRPNARIAIAIENVNSNFPGPEKKAQYDLMEVITAGGNVSRLRDWSDQDA